MSWVPPNLAELCPAGSQVSTCQPPALMFLSFLASTFGYSQDDSFGMVKSDFFSSFDSSSGFDPATSTEISNHLNGYNEKFQARSFDYNNQPSYYDYNQVAEYTPVVTYNTPPTTSSSSQSILDAFRASGRFPGLFSSAEAGGGYVSHGYAAGGAAAGGGRVQAVPAQVRPVAEYVPLANYGTIGGYRTTTAYTPNRVPILEYPDYDPIVHYDVDFGKRIKPKLRDRFNGLNYFFPSSTTEAAPTAYFFDHLLSTTPAQSTFRHSVRRGSVRFQHTTEPQPPAPVDYYYGVPIRRHQPGTVTPTSPAIYQVDPIYTENKYERKITEQEEPFLDEQYVSAVPVNFPEPTGFMPDEYDFIVVGAGSAGCVIANRLSEIYEWKVLLLEAGIDEPLVADVPGFASALRGSNVDWMYRTTRMRKGCRSRRDGTCGWARGKVMGGSSTLNYMMYIRGNRQDYDTWAQIGNEGWSYEEVLPYFKKSEDNENLEVVKKNPYYHSTRGYQTVEWFDYVDQNAKTLLRGWQDIGYRLLDANAAEQLGVVHIQSTAIHGARQSTNGAFIRPIRNKRENLEVKTESHVTRIIVDPHTKVVTGVEYYEARSGFTKVALARKEVVLSAGAINSPKILQLSGIGPAEWLREHKINVVHDSPGVGRNLQDHVTTDGFVIVLSNATATTKTLQEIKADAQQWLERQTGPLSAIGTLSCSAFAQTPFEESPNLPDIQYAFDGTNVDDFVRDPARALETAIYPLSYYNGINIRPVLLSPKSRGTVRLNRTHPVWGAPLMNPHYFEAFPDLDAMVAGIRIAQDLFQTRAFQESGMQMLDVPLPSCRQHKFNSQEYWKCVLMEYTTTIFHPAGTCKMGPKNDPQAVVDPRLRVYGVKRLRVADASIMPLIVRGNTNAPCIMIGEKVSDMIKEDWLHLVHKPGVVNE